jgi:hypothetical protein
LEVVLSRISLVSCLFALVSGCSSSGLTGDRSHFDAQWSPPPFRADHVGLSAEAGEVLTFDVELAEGTSLLYAATRGTGNVDLYIQDADLAVLCASEGEAADESCVVWDPPVGTVRITLVAQTAFTGVDLDYELAGAPEEPPVDTAVEEGPCPSDMVEIEGFCIDRYEAHLEGQSPFGPPAPGVAANAAGMVPQGYISGAEAADACEAAGKRLCSSTEWLRACRGPSGNTYPYGNTYQDGACNEGRSGHPVIELFGSNANWSGTQMNHPELNQLPDSLAPSGEYAECVTEEGVYDMHGNLHEWVADSAGTFRGGFYVDASINGTGCGYRTTAHSFGYHDYSTGFRCCAEPSY